MSKASRIPSRSSAATMPADTTPRMPPPSSTSATRWLSERAPGTEPASARSRRIRATGCEDGAATDIAITVTQPRLVRSRRMSEPLVVGVDVGSQGSCAQALDLDGTLVATSYAPHELSYPRAGWAEQDPTEWTAALVRTLAEVRGATAGREIAALSFGSQIDGVVAADADGTPLRPALIWCDRRAGAECEAVAARVDTERLRELTGCNLDPGHIAPKIAWLARHEPEAYGAAATFACPGSWVAWRATGTLAVDASNASSTGLLDPRGREWEPQACPPFDVAPERLPPVLRADAPLGPVLPWLRDATGLDERTV